MKKAKLQTKKVLGMPFKLVRRTSTGYETWVNTKPQILDPSVYLDMLKYEDGTCYWCASSAGVETEGEYETPQLALKALHSCLQEASDKQQRAMHYIRKRTCVLMGPPHTY